VAGRRCGRGRSEVRRHGCYLPGCVTEVTVNEAHSTMRNVLIEELDPRVRLLTGNHKPFGMMEGIQRRPDLVAFVGYHAGPGESGVLSHTFVAAAVFEVDAQRAADDRGVSERIARRRARRTARFGRGR
jgi:D-aminopeptidase